METIRSESGTTERSVIKRCNEFGDFDFLTGLQGQGFGVANSRIGSRMRGPFTIP